MAWAARLKWRVSAERPHPQLLNRCSTAVASSSDDDDAGRCSGGAHSAYGCAFGAQFSVSASAGPDLPLHRSTSTSVESHPRWNQSTVSNSEGGWWVVCLVNSELQFSNTANKHPTAMPTSPTANTPTFQQLLVSPSPANMALLVRCRPSSRVQSRAALALPGPSPAFFALRAYAHRVCLLVAQYRSGGPSRPMLASGWCWPAIGHNLRELPNGVPIPAFPSSPCSFALSLSAVSSSPSSAVWASPCSRDPMITPSSDGNYFYPSLSQIPLLRTHSPNLTRLHITAKAPRLASSAVSPLLSWS